MTPLIDFRKPSPAPPRGEAFDVVLSYEGYSLHTRVDARSHIEALDIAHARNRENNPALPRLYRSGTAARVHGKAARRGEVDA